MEEGFKNIEEFLGLTRAKINEMKKEFGEQIPSSPGIEYLEAKLKKFEVQPWPFISHLLYNNTDNLSQALTSYQVYDGSVNSLIVIEQLKEKYVLSELLFDLKKLDGH
jgi:hypothetical protein